MPDPLYASPEFTLHPDRVQQDELHARAHSATHLTSNYGATIHTDPDPPREWRQPSEPAPGPGYTSGQPLVDALFNLAKEEAHRNVEEDGTLRTGAKWSGVWTRDVSYSALLAFAIHDPEAVRASLRAKVRRGRVVQDTGTGGAWPVSSDRTTWVLAAWEVYRVTGDEAWLREVYPVTRDTLDDDRRTLCDPATGLYRGESSFLDWREQTYPRWMDGADIYASLCLGTNAVHFRAHEIAARMAELLGEDGAEYTATAERIKRGINDRLWLLDRGYYGQFLYGRGTGQLVSPRFEALGEALCIQFGIADAAQASSIVARSPLTPFGAACIYPQIPDVPPYHNNGIWPFVQGFWNLAAARVGNDAALAHGLAALYRPAALYLSNYENMVAEDGGVAGTRINSHRMLWSIAANLAMVYRVFLGMEFRADGLYFAPTVPRSYGGTRRLTGFRYRGATVDITVTGHGSRIRTVRLDGEEQPTAFLAAETTGHHRLELDMDDHALPYDEINLVANRFSLPTPHVGRVGEHLRWNAVAGAARYHVYRDGELVEATTETRLRIDPHTYATYQVAAVDVGEHEAFASDPVSVTPEVRILQAEAYAPASDFAAEYFTGKGFVLLSQEENRDVRFTVTVEQHGNYLVDFRYANGSGPENTDNKCGIRSLTVNGADAGAVVFPQRGAGDWSSWGFTNAHRLSLRAGENTIRLHFEEWNHNMNGEVNRALLDYLRLTRLA